MENFEFEMVLVEAIKLPLIKIQREKFLRKVFEGRYSSDLIDLAIEYNPAFAGIEREEIHKIAQQCIQNEAMKVTAISALSGIPGGLAVVGTAPVDLVQYFGHLLRILQQLIYLYGWDDLGLDIEEMDEETQNRLILFVGMMFGINEAVGIVNSLSVQVANQLIKKLPKKALTKGIVSPIVKRIAKLIGIRLSKEMFTKTVSKFVPIFGAILSGGLTYATFKPMATTLQEQLSKMDISDKEFYNATQSSD